ncbi:TPA: hypothetical protein ACGHO4_000991 [Salmonella enterica subsp. diarizonae serovar 61:i:z]
MAVSILCIIDKVKVGVMREFDSDSKPVTTDDFIRFVAKFGKSITCPICHGQSWDVQGVVCGRDLGGDSKMYHGFNIIESIHYTHINNKGDVTPIGGGLPVFRVTCNTCAYLMLFSYKRVRAIMDSSVEIKNNEGGVGE